MPFTEYVQAAGSWSVALDPGTPKTIRDEVDIDSWAFSELIITPAHVDAASMGDVGMLAAARYAGVYRKQSASGLVLEGAGMVTLLGDEDGKGNVIGTARSTASGTFAQWAAELLPTNMTAGTVSSISGNYDRSFRFVNFREAIALVCAYFGAEYRVNPDMTLDMGTVTGLYGSTYKAIILGASAGVGAGRDIDIDGVDGAFDRIVDVEDYTTQVMYLTGSTPTVTTAGGSSADFRDPSGFAAFIERKIEATADDGATPSTMAASLLAQYNSPRIEWNADGSDEFDLGSVAPVGSRVYLWDPAKGLADAGNSVQFRGAQLQPVASRLMGLETPIRAGVGVYLRRMVDASTAEYTDLTPYVAPETGVQRLSLGAIPRQSS